MGRWVILPPDPFIRRISVFEIGQFVRRTLPCMVTLWKENEEIARGSGGRMTETHRVSTEGMDGNGKKENQIWHNDK